MQQMPQYGPLMQSIMALDSFDKRRREYKRVGWIYAARNPSFADPVFKIGQSKVSPAVRVGQLSSSTSVYRPFELVYWVHVSDRDRAEGYAHQLLQEHRVKSGTGVLRGVGGGGRKGSGPGCRVLSDSLGANGAIGVPGAWAGTDHGSVLTLRHRESRPPVARSDPHQLRQLRRDAHACGASESRLNLPTDRSGGVAKI